MNNAQRRYLIGFAFCLLAAVGTLYFARDQERILSLYGPSPQSITVADLAAKGFGDNIWVELTEVEPGNEFVIEKGTTTKTVWVPAFPAGQAESAAEIQVLLRTRKAFSEADIEDRFTGRQTFQGAVVNPVELDSREAFRPLLGERYPKKKLASTIWVVDIDDDDGPPSPHWAVGFHTAAIGLGTTALICCLAFVGEVARREREAKTPPAVPSVPSWSGHVWR
jgi:hypothetical protein